MGGKGAVFSVERADSVMGFGGETVSLCLRRRLHQERQWYLSRDGEGGGGDGGGGGMKQEREQESD